MKNDERHRFEPQAEPGLESQYVIAACSCGWTGGRYPTEERGYEEAEAEYDLHIADELEEVEPPT